MAWIELHQSLPSHRKTLAAADALDIAPVQMVGHLACFWLWALDNAPNGVLETVTLRTIARAAQWTGDAALFLATLESVGYLERRPDDTLEIHDWYDYAGKLIDRRQVNAERMRAVRAMHVRNTCSVERSRTCVATVPNRTVPNRTKPHRDSDPQIEEVYLYFKAKIQPDSRKCPSEKIAARLKAFKTEELKQGVDNFAADAWWMENNGSRGAAWFFHSDERSEQFLHLKPRTSSTNGQRPERPAPTVPSVSHTYQDL